MVIAPPKPKRPRRLATRSCLGPVADLEAHLPEEWWRKLFNALYVKTDGDVVENRENTRREVDFIVSAAAVQPHSNILDLCCGQGRHSLELARRGFKHVMGLDRSRYLVRLAKKRAQTEGLQVLFKEGDARNPRLPESSVDCVAIMGNSFGYFSNKQDDEKVLTAVGKILRPSGQLVLDITDGAHMHENFEKRSWEWIDEHHFVCRERSISQDGERLISREVIVHDEMGVIADQFYAERLYTRESISKLLEKTGFRNVRLLRRAVDTRLFDPVHRDERLRAEWGLAPGDLAVIHVGRLAPEKNLELALRAFEAIRARHPRARCVVVGDGPARAELQQAHPDIVFTGIRRGEDLARHYASGDLFLFPSLTETFGNVTLEALASGVPTIAFDYGAAREYLRDGVHGAAIAPNEEGGFIAQCVRIAADDTIRESMRDAARQAVSMLRPEQVSADFDALLQQLSEARRSGATDTMTTTAEREAS